MNWAALKLPALRWPRRAGGAQAAVDVATGATPRYAGLRLRAAAAVIDALLLWVVTVPLIVAIYGREYGVLAREGYAGFWDFILEAVVPPLALVLYWRTYGATPGKMLFDLKIVDAACGARVPTARLVVRALAYVVSALPLGAGFLWIAIDRRKQGWHDKIAGTVVIYDE